MSRKILHGMLWSASLFCISQGLSAQTEPFTLVTRTDAHTEVAAHRTQRISRSHPFEMALAVQGAEQSQCRLSADPSAGSTQARVVKEFESSNTVSFTLQADGFAKGGSYINCSGGCITVFGKQQCIFIEPEYTRGYAFSRATANVDIKFADDARFLPYNLIFSAAPSTGSAPGAKPSEMRLRLLAPDGSTLLSESSPGLPVRIPGGGGLTYQLFVELIANAAGDGGGSEYRQGTVRFGMRLERAPIMESADDPIIGGGELTSDFPAVGALLWDGKGHCTGTLIGRRTVLTAAHCVYGFEDVSRMSFLAGENLSNPDPLKMASVKAVYYPQPDRDGFGYEDLGLKHDIAVVALNRDFDGSCHLPDAAAHQAGLSTLEKIIQNKDKVLFLGFGHKVVDGKAVDPGKKRKVEIPITELDENKFYYFNPGKSTCAGDSGGPILKQVGNKLYVLGVASAGNCRDEGWQMNVEYYGDWIRKRLQEIEGDAPAVVGGPGEDSGEPANDCPCAPLRLEAADAPARALEKAVAADSSEAEAEPLKDAEVRSGRRSLPLRPPRQ